MQRGITDGRRHGDAEQLRTAAQLQRPGRLPGTNPHHATGRRTDHFTEHPVGTPAVDRRPGNTATQPPSRGNTHCTQTLHGPSHIEIDLRSAVAENAKVDRR